MDLSEKRCVPCRGGVPTMGAGEAERLVSDVPGWTLEADAKGIGREFRFRNFAESMRFADRVGLLHGPLPDPRDPGLARERFHHGRKSESSPPTAAIASVFS